MGVIQDSVVPHWRWHLRLQVKSVIIFKAKHEVPYYSMTNLDPQTTIYMVGGLNWMFPNPF